MINFTNQTSKYAPVLKIEAHLWLHQPIKIFEVMMFDEEVMQT